MPFRFHRPVLLSLILPALTAGTLIGQTNSEINSSIQFNFSPPGARSLALAGAFLALADDATAALPAAYAGSPSAELQAQPARAVLQMPAEQRVNVVRPYSPDRVTDFAATVP